MTQRTRQHPPGIATLLLTTLLSCASVHAASPADPDEGGIGGTGHSDSTARPELPERPDLPERIEHERPDILDTRDNTDMGTSDQPGEIIEVPTDPREGGTPAP